MDNEPADITQFLERWGHGDPQALEEVIPLVYAQLRAIAETRCGASTPSTPCSLRPW